MKVVSWNVENALRCLPALPEIVVQLGSPEVLCLQELRIRERDAEAIAALQRALPGYRCHRSLPRDPRNVTFRGGRMYSVATFVRGRWRGEVPAWDREGRVVVVGRPGLAVVNFYAVNGTAKPWGPRTQVADCATKPSVAESGANRRSRGTVQRYLRSDLSLLRHLE